MALAGSVGISYELAPHCNWGARMAQPSEIVSIGCAIFLYKMTGECANTPGQWPQKGNFLWQSKL